MTREPSRLLDDALRRSGLSARDLARRTGVAESRISDYRAGRHDPGASRLLELLAATGADVRLGANFDRNGLILGELFDLADALAAGGSVTRDERIPSFRELVPGRD